MSLSAQEARFYVGPSSVAGAGNGLFAAETLNQGNRLEVVGVLIQPGSVADVCTHYADAYKFRVGSLLLIPLGHAGMVNHSETPNLEKVIEGEKAYLRATRLIARGEELFFTYSEYAQIRFGLRKED